MNCKALWGEHSSQRQDMGSAGTDGREVERVPPVQIGRERGLSSVDGEMALRSTASVRSVRAFVAFVWTADEGSESDLFDAFTPSVTELPLQVFLELHHVQGVWSCIDVPHEIDGPVPALLLFHERVPELGYRRERRLALPESEPRRFPLFGTHTTECQKLKREVVSRDEPTEEGGRPGRHLRRARHSSARQFGAFAQLVVQHNQQLCVDPGTARP